MYIFLEWDPWWYKYKRISHRILVWHLEDKVINGEEYTVLWLYHLWWVTRETWEIWPKTLAQMTVSQIRHRGLQKFLDPKGPRCDCGHIWTMVYVMFLVLIQLLKAPHYCQCARRFVTWMTLLSEWNSSLLSLPPPCMVWCGGGS